jgi:hypothetical protein
MKKQSLEILHRYRKHLLEKDQIVLQDKIAEENQQKARLLQLQSRVQATHEAKLKATSAEELRALDEAAAYLHGRMTLARDLRQRTGPRGSAGSDAANQKRPRPSRAAAGKKPLGDASRAGRIGTKANR